MSGTTPQWSTAKLRAGAPEAGHHFVGDQQHAVPAADLGETRPVLVGRNQRASGRADDGLCDDGRDRLGALALDQRFDRVHAGDVAARSRRAERTAQAVARWRLRPLDEQRLETGAALLVTADGQRSERGAVVREIATDHLPALRAARRDVVLAGESQRRVDRLGAAAREGDARESAREPAADETLSQRDALVGGERRDDVARRFEAARHGLGDLAASVTHVYDDRAARGVEDASPVRQLQPRALGACDRDADPARYEGVALDARGVGDRSGSRVAHGAA